MQPKAAGSPWPFCLAVLAFLVLPWGALGAQGAGPSPALPAGSADTTPGWPANPLAVVLPKVVNLDGNLEIDDDIWIEVDGLAEWSKANDPAKLIPYINGRGIRGNYPVEIERKLNRLSYHLEISPENREIWADLLGEPRGIRKNVTLSVGLEGDSPFNIDYRDKKSVSLTVISPLYGVVAAVLTLLMMVLLLRLARTTNLLRESGPCPVGGKLRPYNMGRMQMAFWFFLVYVSYLGIWLLTDTLDTITASLLGLIGISAGTALSEALIDSGKDSASAVKLQDLAAEKQALEQGIPGLQAHIAGVTARTELAPDNLHRQLQDSRGRLAQVNLQLEALSPSASSGVSRGFLHDVLSDGSGYSFHRFQIFAWTILLGIMFVSSVYNDLTMPEFSATLLGLMGISSGTYIGFKFPEQK
jgi:hypothetical protein